MKFAILLVSAGLVPFATAASNVCSSGLLPLLAPLSTWPAAVSYCSSKYPGTTTTVTVTAPATLTTTITTSTQTLSPTAPYKKRNARRKAAFKRFRERMEAARLEPRAGSTSASTKNLAGTTTTTTAPPTTTTAAPSTTTTTPPITTTTPPITTTPPPLTTTTTPPITTTAPPTTVSTKSTATTTSTSTTTSACGAGKAGLFSNLVAQASAIVSEFCSCYDPAVTKTSTTTVTPTSTITTTSVTSSQLPQQTLACPSVDRPDPTDTHDVIDGTGCPTLNGLNCRCNVRAGQPTTGPGVCSAAPFPDEPCTSDADCPNGRYCLGYLNFVGGISLSYSCSTTEACAN